MEEIIENESMNTTDKELAPSTNDSEEMTDVEQVEESTPDEKQTEEALSPLEALMRVGLSEREANLVLRDREGVRPASQTPSDSLPRMAHSPRLNISYGELMQMKEIFEGLSDTEINRLYNKVTN